MIRVLILLIGAGALIGLLAGAFIVDRFQNLEAVLP
jgi:predicted MFS family arabinose efflux permease